MITERSLRVACDLGKPDASLDPRTNNFPIAIRGADLLLQLAAFRDGAIVDDVSNYETLTAIIRSVNDDGSLGVVIASEAIAGAALAPCTENAWDAGTGQHAQLSFDGDDLNIAGGNYKLIAYGITTAGVLVPWAHCTFKVLDVGLVDGAPPEPASDYYTRAEADTLFTALGGGSSAVRISANGAFIQLKDEATALWHSLWVKNGALQIGAGEA